MAQSYPYGGGAAMRIQAAAATYVKGRCVVLGASLFIAAESKVLAAVGGLDVWTGPLYLRNAPRDAGDAAWTAGAKVYWDASNNYFTTTASGNTLAGIAAKAAASADTEADVIFLTITQD